MTDHKEPFEQYKAYNHKFYSSVFYRGKLTANIVLTLLARYFDPKVIFDYGCGYGAWAIESAQLFPKSKVIGFDFKAAIEKNNLSFNKITNLSFSALDLAAKSNSYNNCDLAICLEVVEHIPENSALNLIEQMCKTAKVILFSGAIPGQGGTEHINEQPLKYWISQFNKHGWIAVDLVRPTIVSNKAIPSYYKSNIFVFVPVSNLQKIVTSIHSMKLQNIFISHIGQTVDNRTYFLKIRYYIIEKLPKFLIDYIAKIRNSNDNYIPIGNS
jgi:SAM-dependent methyltransferase